MTPVRLLAAGAIALTASAASAHYGMIIPSDNMVAQEEGRSVSLAVSFSHPFEGDGMYLATPAAFAVTHDGETRDLLGDLKPATIMDAQGFTLDYALDRPGAHVFSMTPTPYWEPEEDAFITHYTKTYIAAYDDDEGWDAELGLKTEIVPLTKPFGLWRGNVFQGVVKLAQLGIFFQQLLSLFCDSQMRVDPCQHFFPLQRFNQVIDSTGIKTA